MNLKSIAFSFLLPVGFCQAATITSVNFSQTQTEDGYYLIEIQGSNLPSSPTIAVYDDFNTYTEGEDISLGSAHFGNWARYGDMVGKPSAQKYSRIKNQGTPLLRNISTGQWVRDPDFSDGNKVAKLEVQFPRTNQIFFSYSVQVPEGSYFSGASSDMSYPSISSWKYTWIMDGAGANSDQSRFDLCVPTHTGGGNFLIGGNSLNLDWLPDSFDWSWHEQNYFSFGLMANQSDPINSNGYSFLWHTAKDSSPMNHVINNKPLMRTGVSTAFDRVVFPGWWGNGDTSNFKAIYDDIYVATGPNALARLELINSDTNSTATYRVTIPFTYWSETQITAAAPSEAVNTLRNLHLVLYDKDNNTIGEPRLVLCKMCPGLGN